MTEIEPLGLGRASQGDAPRGVKTTTRLSSWATWLVWGSQCPTGVRAATQVRARVGMGVLAVVIVFWSAGALHAFATPPFAPPDETAHVGYALELSEGRIPLIDEIPEERPIPGMREGLSMWTANHPPGTYALMAIPLRGGVETDNPVAGFYAARLLNVAAAGVALLFVARIAALVVPHRPRVIVGATALAGLWPYSIQIAGTAYTDGLALCVTIALVLAAVTALVRGPSWMVLGWLTVLSALGGLARAPTAVLIVLAGLAWGIACLIHLEGEMRNRLFRGIAGGLLIGIVAALAAGWFYLGNIAIYGDPTGSEALFELHNREPRAAFWDIVFRAHDYRWHVYLLWNRYEGVGPLDAPLMQWTINWLYRAFAVVLFSALAVFVHRIARLSPRAAALLRTSTKPLPAGRSAAWALLIIWWVALFAMMIVFVSGGGSAHARYLWGGAAGFGLGLAIGADALRTPRLYVSRNVTLPSLSVGLLLSVGALLWGNASSWLRYLETLDLSPSDLVDAAVKVVTGTGIVPAPGWSALVLVVASVSGAAVLMWSLLVLPAHAEPGFFNSRVSGNPPVSETRTDLQHVRT